LDGYWWNLNSLLKDGPEFVGEIYLSAFLDTLNLEGYSIFVVRGSLPKGENLGSSFGGGRGTWINKNPPGQNFSSTPQPFSSTGYVLGEGSRDFEFEVEQGMDFEEGLGGGMLNEEDFQFQRALQLSLQTAQEEKKKKLPPEPEQGEDVTQIVIRGPQGDLKRRFLKTDKLELLPLFLESSGIDLKSYKLYTSLSSTPLDNFSSSFEEAGLHPRSLLILKF